MKLFKTLTCTIGLTSLVTPILGLTSCATQTTTNHVTYMGKKEFDIEYGDSITLVFGLDKEFDVNKDKIDIFYDFEQDNGFLGYSYDVNGRTVSLKIFVANKIELYDINDITLDVRFRTKGWTEIIKNFRLNYSIEKQRCVKALAKQSGVFTSTNVGGNNPNIEYSINGLSWNRFNGTVSLSAGDKLYLKGTNRNGFSHASDRYTTFNFTGEMEIYGNVMGLLNNNGEDTSFDQTTIPNNYCFYKLFNNSNISYVSPYFLPAENITNYCYCHMFKNCENLKQTPYLPAEKAKEGCYESMFEGCTNLQDIYGVSLLETARLCCYRMFANCSSLESCAFSLSPTKLSEGCYKQMFINCPKLYSVPTIGADIFGSGIESGDVDCMTEMFKDCSSLMIVKGEVPAPVWFRIFTLPQDWDSDYAKDIFSGVKRRPVPYIDPQAGETYYCYYDRDPEI